MDNLSNIIMQHIGPDGLLHYSISFTCTVLLHLFLPWYAAAAIVLSIGIAKEIYDKVSGKGCCEWKDIVCDAAGCLLGIL